MKPVLSSEIEDRTRTLLTDLLLDVALARKQGTPEEYLATLERAIAVHPVFRGWPTPVDGWLDEAERLATELHQPETLAAVMLRRAEVHMRRLEYEEALVELDRAVTSRPSSSPALVASIELTRARVFTRQQQFDAARRLLDGVAVPASAPRVSALAALARGEWQLEGNDIDAAERTLRHALQMAGPDLVEDRIQALQSLGFIAISRANAPAALDHLDQARQMLRGSGAWREVVQMNLVVGGFLVAAGRQGDAQALFDEAIGLSRDHPEPQLAPLLRIALARSQAAEGRVDEAVSSALQATSLYAAERDIVGFVSTIVLIANLYLEARNYVEGYRTLATGVAIARHRRWLIVESILRTHINRLRDETLGHERFDDMVRGMLDELQRPH